MLENEPDTDQPTTNGEPSTPPAAPPRRRRAASRPAGPPASAQDAPTIEKAPAVVAQLAAEPVNAPLTVNSQVEVQAPEQPQTESPAPTEESQPEVGAPGTSETAKRPTKKAAAKRPARKTAAKKTAAAVPADDAGTDLPVTEVAPVSDTSEEAAGVAEPPADAPKKRAPRKRTAKKLPGAEPAASGEPAAAAPSEQVAVEAPHADAAAGDRPAGWEAPTDASSAVPSSVDETTAEPADNAPTAEIVPTSPDRQPSVEPEAELVAAEDAFVGDDPTVVTPDASQPDDGAVVEAPRDFGWLADPFAVPAQQPSAAAQPDLVDGSEETADVVAPEESGADADDTDDSAETSDDESGDGGNRRRRRRRGGRRRRRSGGDEDAADSDSDDESSDEADQGAEPAVATARTDGTGGEDARSADDSGDEADGDESEGQRRRRRRRRRRGEETAALPDDPTDVVVRVREPRARKKAASEEVTGIQGSTRMEAKRQRRKEGRDAGRRRAPILSEAEFLARRESVNRKMIIRQREDTSAGSVGSLAQIAVLEDGILVEHYVDRDSAASLIGNVYLGRVQNVLPSMEAAFIDIGRGRNAVLYAGEVDWDSFGAEGHNRKVEKVLKSGQMILVQVSKDPVGAKGARLTNHVSIPGRYVVYAPGGHLSGISRKLPDVERRRLKDILAELVGESASVIVRTAAEGASEEELVRDVNRLKAQWEDIERKVKAGNSPQLLYGEPDLTVRIVRDLFTEDFSELIIQGNGSMNDAYDAITGYVTHVAPHLQERIRRWEPNGEQDLFSEYRLDEQIAKALERKVFLPSGGSLVIDRTEAMTVIDVNTGKFTGTGGNLEATVTSNNLEAAEEIVNQLRLRDIGGIIVIDFIDMVLPSNRELLLRRLVECLGRDRTRHQVAEVTSLGLVQMTRKKIGTGLLEAFGTECPHCLGRGFLLHDAPVDTQKQADGGSRESRPQNHRPRPGDGQRGGGARGDSGRGDSGRGDSGRGDSGRGDSGRGDSGHGDNSRGGGGSRQDQTNGHAQQGVPAAVDEAVAVSSVSAGEDGGDQSDRTRSRRGRRGGRSGAAREPQGEAAGADTGQQVVEGEPDSNREFYDQRERENSAPSRDSHHDESQSADAAPVESGPDSVAESQPASTS